MTFLFGLIRVGASVAAFAAGMLAWPLWVMPIIIAVHAVSGHLFSRAAFREVSTKLATEDADPDVRARYETFYAPEPSRDLAMAFVRCGLAFAAGWAFAQWVAPPTGGPARPPIINQN